jgi:hypothetical protein
MGDATLWYYCLGYLGSRALENLNTHTIGTKIKGIRTVDCKAYSTIKLRRQTRRKKRLRPLVGERFTLDFYEFKPNKKKDKQLMLIVDRYSGML